MATRANTSVARKETKKATPLSNSRSKQTNNVVGATTSVANKVKTTTPSPSAKPVPNYLRHTTSSSKSDILTPTKKTISEDLSRNVDRRRSFDRPPSAIRNHKSLISPDPRDRVLSRERQLATRSSSFSPSSSSSKVPSSPKPILERNAKSLKPIRPQPTSSVRRTSSFSKTTNSVKNGSGIASSHSTKSSTNGNVEESNQELEIKDQSSVQEANNGESEDVHMQKDDIKDDIIVDFVQGSENIKDGTTTEEDGEAIIDTFVKLKLIEGSSETLDENREEEEEINHTHEEEDNKLNDQEKEEEEEESSSSIAIDQPAEERIADDDAPEIETEEDKVEESEDQNVIVESSKDELEEIAVKELKESSSFNGGRQGKRESPAAYNDVIEETKNKLLEKRKNKVKALVGAFETVIDYETAGVNK